MSGVVLDRPHEPVTGIFHGKVAMWLFLASEIMFFAGFFAAFVILQRTNPLLFAQSAQELNVALATLNTVVLISSSLTMAFSILYLEKGEKAKFQTFLFLTFIGACIFLVVKYFEYTAKFSHGITPQTNTFFSMYFLMTGFHGIHVVGGMIPMAWMLIRSMTSKGYTNYKRVEVLGLYWHFVDLVWIFLFPVVYLLFKDV